MNQSDVEAHRCTDLRYVSSSSSLVSGDLGGTYDVLLSGRSVLINSRAILLSDSGILIRFLLPSLRDCHLWQNTVSR